MRFIPIPFDYQKQVARPFVDLPLFQSLQIDYYQIRKVRRSFFIDPLFSCAISLGFFNIQMRARGCTLDKTI